MAASVFPDQPEAIQRLSPHRALFQQLALGCAVVARLLQHAELVLVGLAAPTLMFPGRATAAGVAIVASTWLVRRVATGRWSVATRIDRWVPLFAIALFVSLVPSVRLEYSAPKFWGLVLGLAVLYAVANTCRTRTHLRLAEFGLLLVGAALAVGVAGMASPPDKLIDDRGLYAALPHLIASVQSSTVVTQGINPNELAGTLILLIPLAGVRACQRGYLRWPALAFALVMTTAVLLTQSRAALLGLLAAACVGIVWAAGRRGLVAVVVLLVVGAQSLIVVDGADHLRQQVFGDAPTAGVESLSGRVELWQRGLAMAMDMPFTGIGLNTFPLVLQADYPTILHPPTTVLPHVHDLYLQTLLDFGLPGLVAWLAIVATAVACGLSAVRARVHAALVTGLLLGLLAHGVYSLVDAVTLGAKPGVLVWFILGLLLTAGARAQTVQPSSPGSRFGRWPSVLRSRWPLLAVTVALTPLVVAAASLNTTTLILHHSISASSPRLDPDLPLASALRIGASSPLLDADLQSAQTLAIEPLATRVYAARALLAHQRGDPVSEREFLDRAVASGGAWDPSLALRLGDLHFAAGDRPGAIAAWRAAVALPALLDRAASAPADQALDWYSLSQSVDPTDWRPYAGAARLLESKDPNRSAALVSEALRLRASDPARASLAKRLLDPMSPLPASSSIDPSPNDVNMLLLSSRLLQARGDFPGALYAAQLSTQAAPTWPATWQHLATLLDTIRPTQAADARSRAEHLEP